MNHHESSWIIMGHHESSWVLWCRLTLSELLFTPWVGAVPRRKASGKALEGLGDLRDPRAGHDSETFSKVEEIEGVGINGYNLVQRFLITFYNLHKLGSMGPFYHGHIKWNCTPSAPLHTMSSKGTASCKHVQGMICAFSILFQSHTKESR